MRVYKKFGVTIGALVLTFGVASIGFAGSQSLNGGGVWLLRRLRAAASSRWTSS